MVKRKGVVSLKKNRQAILGLLLMLVFAMTACDNTPENAKLTKTKNLFVKETVKEVFIPEKYRENLHMHNTDSDWMYFSYSKKADGDTSPLRMFKASKKTGEIIEFLSVRGDRMMKCMRGYNGNMYIGMLDEHGGVGVYKIIELTASSKKVLYEKRVDVLPMTMSSGNKEIMVISHIDTNENEQQTLEVFDLETLKTTIIDRAKNVPSEKVEGMKDGTLFMGFDYTFDSASSDGFCYEKCKYYGENENTEYGGENKAYYYSFKTKKKKSLKEPNGALEYINGTPGIYLTSTFTGGIDSDGNESALDDYGEANMVILNENKYEEVSLNKIIEGVDADIEVGDSGTICAGGMIGKDNAVFKSAGAGFFIINRKTFEYCYIDFKSGYDDVDGEKEYTYPECIGYSFDNAKKTLSFLTKDKTKGGHKYVLHTLSGE